MPSETYWYLAVLNGVLSIVSMVALIILVASKDDRKIVSWATVAYLLSAALFLVATFRSARLAIALTEKVVEYLSLNPFARQPPTSRWLLGMMQAGWVALLAGIGLSGWIRSRLVGIASTVFAIVALVLALLV